MTTQRGPHAAVADAVEGYIEGEKIGKAVLSEVERGVADPKAFHFAWRAAATAWGEQGAEGFARSLQKRLERATS